MLPPQIDINAVFYSLRCCFEPFNPTPSRDFKIIGYKKGMVE